jgi:hypothetical protein
MAEILLEIIRINCLILWKTLLKVFLINIQFNPEVNKYEKKRLNFPALIIIF